MSWIDPLESRKVANASFPMSRSSITRPATAAVTPLPAPSARSAWAACRSAARSVTSTR
jgi:hypothetical protein